MTTSVDALMGGRDLPYSRVIEATFDSLADVMAAKESLVGETERETQKRMGVITLVYETREL